MSPAAVDFRSPITSPLPKPSSTTTTQNPNPNPPVPEMPSSSTFNLGASNDNGTQWQFGSAVPSRSARSRPRLVKQRKQHLRSRTGSGGESGPGVNPFCSVSDGGINGFNFANGDCQGEGFVFGARTSGEIETNSDNGEGEMARNLDNGEGESCEMVRNLRCDETGEVNTGNGEKPITYSSGEMKLESEVECNVGSELCAGRRDSAPNLNTDDGETAGFLFNAELDGFSSISNLGDWKYSGTEGKSGCDGIGSTNTGDEAGERKYNDTDFVFGPSWSCNLNANSGKENSSGLHVESETEFEKVIANPSKFHAEEESCVSNKDHIEGSFVFGSCIEKDSGLADCEVDKCQAEMNRNGENLGDCNPVSESNYCDQCLGGPYVASEKNNGDNREGSDPNQNHILSGSDSFTAAPDAFGVCFEDFKVPFWDPSCLKANLFPELNKTSKFSVKHRSARDKRSRKQKGKSKKPSMTKQGPGQDHVSKESNTHENLDHSGCYSPMDFSPYEETGVADLHSRETSVTCTDSFHPVDNIVPCTSNAAVPGDRKGEDLAAAGSGLGDTGDLDQVCKEPIEENSGYHSERIFFHEFLWKGSGSGAEAETHCFTHKNEHAGSISGACLDSEEARSGSGLNTERQENDCGTPLFASGFETKKDKYFTFLASPSVQESSVPAKRLQRRKKHRMKVGHETFAITPSPNVEVGSVDVFTSHSSKPLFFDAVGKSEADEQFKHVHVSSSAATHETCEKWRIRGNDAYKNGDLSKAEDFYTQGIISIPSNERTGCCLKPLLLCYSNRAATRMSLGRIREALGDCVMAMALDPDFLKVQMRAANCHLLLGEVENARQYFSKCSESGTGVCLDRRTIIDSADGLQRVQKVVECTNRSAKLMIQRTSGAALTALEIISEALSVSSYSEKLLEMKAEALCLLRRYEEAIQLCEQSVHFAERNFTSPSNVENMDFSGCEIYPVVRLWRWFFISKSYFHLGRLDAALDVLEKLGKVGSTKDLYASKKLESSVSLAVTMRELLSHKNAGNEAFKSGRYTEAVEHYTVALSSNRGSQPFSAICLCNRAAAHQALSLISDAIADCSLAIALDGDYVKAVSRRATLHEMIRDYGQAASDLQRLISILEKQSNDKEKESSSKGRSNGNVKELRNAHRRMPLMEEEAKKGIPLDFYLILGIKSSDASSDIKKAYRKAALKHHPDKAGQFLARSESGDEGQLWKEISLEVNKDADRLFKMIGEAYVVLSDPTKRSQYDLEEEMRKVEIECKESSIYRKASDFQSPGRGSYRRPDSHSSPFDRSSNSRNYSREYWRTYGNSYSQW